MILAQAMSRGRANNLDAVRLAAAAAVVVSHAWPLALGRGTAEPLHHLTGQSLGGWALGLFFFLSGLLISQSAANRPPRAFWAARARRILPGLGAALVLSLGLAVASGGAPSAQEAVSYLLRGFTLVSIEHSISGAYPANPWPEAVNGPLWSLFHEVAAYGLCFALVASGLLRGWLGMAAFLLAAGSLWVAAPLLPVARLSAFAPLFMAFALGMAAWRWREALPLRADIAAALAGLAFVAGAWPLVVAAVGYGALLIAYRLPARPLGWDLSYGTYLLGWPVAQTLLHHVPDLSAPALALLSLSAVLPLAAASWLWVERPLLRRAPVRLRSV
jgi:peptidoglycan/LPS O-acetylase OafA/YrhL